MSSAWQAAPPAVPALVVGTVAHTRHRPTKHAFRYRAYQWLVDIDDLPRYRWPLRLVTGFGHAITSIADGSEAGSAATSTDSSPTAGSISQPMTAFSCSRTLGFWGMSSIR